MLLHIRPLGHKIIVCRVIAHEDVHLFIPDLFKDSRYLRRMVKSVSQFFFIWDWPSICSMAGFISSTVPAGVSL